MRFDIKKEKGNKDALNLLRQINLTKKQIKYIEGRFEQYLIFNNKKGIGYCTACHRAIKGKFRHNEKNQCPMCKKELMAKSEGMISKHDVKYVMQFQKIKSGTIATIIESGRTIPKHGIEKMIAEDGPIIEYYPDAIYFFSQEKQRAYECYAYSGWMKNETICIKGGLQFEYIAIDQENLETVLDKSDLRYMRSFIRASAQGMMNCPNELIKRMALCSRYPQVEFLLKMGFHQLLKEKLWRCKNYRTVDWKQRTPEKLLKLSKQEIKMLRGYDPEHHDLAIIQKSRRDGNPIRSIEELEKISRAIRLDDYKEPLKHTTLRKLLNYKEKELAREKESGKPIGTYSFAETYKDYLRMAEELEYDITNSYYLMPKNLRAAHDKLTEEYNEMKERNRLKSQKEKMERYANRLKRILKYRYEDEHFLIRPAENEGEFIKEGKALRHCVASYYDRAERGQTNIFVIREKKDPDKPFYTLELSNSKVVVQCRGEGNRTMTDEVNAFVDKWMKEIRKNQNRKKKEAA